jgi:hypothetical protein
MRLSTFDSAPSTPTPTCTHPYEREVRRRLALWLAVLKRARELQDVRSACAELGLHRTSFYRIWKLHRRGGVDALLPAVRRSVARDPEFRELVQAEVLSLTAAHPNWGRQRIASTMRDNGWEVSARWVWNIWQRHGLLRPERSNARRGSARADRSEGRYDATAAWC